MILLLPLQEFMSLTSVQGKHYASAPCSIFYASSLHAAWVLRQVTPKLLRSSFCIELMVVALAPTVPRVNSPLSPISISTLSVPSFVLLWVTPPLDLAMHPPMHSLEQDHMTTPRRLLNPLSFMELLFVEVLLLNMCSPSHMILPLESRDLSLLDNYPI